MSQMDAARIIWLNQLEEVRREWVDDAARGEMLRKRLDMLKHEKSNSIKTGSRLFCVCCPFVFEKAVYHQYPNHMLFHTITNLKY